MQIEVVVGDITKLNVDAIVNAANCSLLGGGGVDGAIHRAAGRELLEACAKFGGCKTGDARITPGFKLPAKHVIHTPGPIFRDGLHGEPELLANCYRNSFALAIDAGCKTIAFPAISCGVYGYPKMEACSIAVREAKNIAERSANTLERCIFCCFNEDMASIYREILKE